MMIKLKITIIIFIGNKISGNSVKETNQTLYGKRWFCPHRTVPLNSIIAQSSISKINKISIGISSKNLIFNLKYELKLLSGKMKKKFLNFLKIWIWRFGFFFSFKRRAVKYFLRLSTWAGTWNSFIQDFLLREINEKSVINGLKPASQYGC